jgi:hypothetical protein
MTNHDDQPHAAGSPSQSSGNLPRTNRTALWFAVVVSGVAVVVWLAIIAWMATR